MTALNPLTPAETDAAVRQCGYPPDQAWAVRERLAGLDDEGVARVRESLSRRAAAAGYEREWRCVRNEESVTLCGAIAVPVGPNVGERPHA